MGQRSGARLRPGPALAVGFAFLIGLAGCVSPPAPSAPAQPAAEAAPLAPAVAPVDYAGGRGERALLLMVQRGGRTSTVEELTASVRELERTGMPAEEALAATARRQGLWPHAQYGTIDQLAERIHAGVFVLVQLQDTTDPQTFYYAVVTRHQPDARVFQIQTGDGRRFRMSEGELWARWKRVRFWMMTLCPPEAGRWDLSGLEHISRMQFLDGMGQHAQADIDAARALLLTEGKPDRLVTLGVRERARGRLPAAEDLLRRALARDPTHVRALNNLAYLLAEQGRNLDEAERLSRQAVLREPTNPRVLDTLGFVLQAQGRWEEALPVYERAYQRARHMIAAVRRDIGLHLVQVYLHLERREEAGRLLGELRQAEPGLLLSPELAELIPPAP